MPLAQAEFEAILADSSKRIEGDIVWLEDEDHSPSFEFRAEIISDVGWPIFIRGSMNGLARTLTYALIHRGVGRIYGLDLGKDHHNPSCEQVGERHKHRWNERWRDKEAYVPTDVTADVNHPVLAWREFCQETRLTHAGELKPPPRLERSRFV